MGRGRTVSGDAARPVDLLVVGFGPVGATLAGLGARHGLSVLAVDREVDMFPLPRAAHCDHEVLRILQELGCADEVVAGAVTNDGMDFLDADREVLFGLRSATGTGTGWPASILFHQPSLEGALRRAALATSAEVRLGRGVTTLTEHDGLVHATLDDGSVVTARIAVGCDGGRSFVRRAIGTTMDDLRFEEPWLVMDLLLDGPVEELPSRAWQVCDPARPTTLVPMPAPRFRFEFMVLAGEDPDELQRPERTRELLSTWLDPDRVTVERAAVYTFHGLVAREWRAGRILLAGDAAHQMPPFLGQGMCSGMRDAANLAWKLAEVLRRGTPWSLLDSYQAEREPHVRTIVETAITFGRIICTTDPDVAAERDAGFRAADATDRTPDLQGLGEGPGIGPGGGALSLQPCLGGRLLDDVVGPRFLVLTAAPLAADDTDRRWWSTRACLVDATTQPELAGLLGDDEAVVVRPDRYEFGRGPLDELTARVRAWLEPA